jgi:hypothetical protein
MSSKKPRAVVSPMGLLCAIVLVWAGGCQETPAETFAPRHPSDLISRQEMEAFLAVLEAVGKEKPAALPPLWMPASRWSRTRTLPVSELVRSEERLLEERANVAWVASHSPKLPAWDRALRAQKLTREQFAGLYTAFALAIARDAVPPARDLARLVALGKKYRRELARDERVFAALCDEAAFAAQEQSAWVVIAHRASRLAPVPPQNLALVRQYKERLLAALPQETARNPFAQFASILDTHGVPFIEPAAGPTDLQFALPGVDGLIE